MTTKFSEILIIISILLFSILLVLFVFPNLEFKELFFDYNKIAIIFLSILLPLVISIINKSEGEIGRFIKFITDFFDFSPQGYFLSTHYRDEYLPFITSTFDKKIEYILNIKIEHGNPRFRSLTDAEVKDLKKWQKIIKKLLIKKRVFNFLQYAVIICAVIFILSFGN